MAINTTRVSAGEALDVLQSGWAAQSAGHMRVSYMLHGRPGVGKTQVVQQLADQIGGKLFDIRLTTIEPQDLRGLPAFDHETQTTTWYRPEDLPSDPATPAVLFLDELTAAQPWLQPTVYGLLQERRVGRHSLPDSVFIVAAGNMVEDGAVAYEMGTGLSDRLIHLHVVASPADWLAGFAVDREIHPTVVAFLRTRPDLLETTEETLADGRMIAATPRSWERVSQILHAVPDRRIRDIMISGTVGETIAAEFALLADEIAATVRVDEMLTAAPGARLRLYPETMHGLTALVYGLVGALSEKTAPRIIEIMGEVRHLARLRTEPVFQRLPLAELCTYGFEALIRKGLEMDLAETFLNAPAYKAYSEERRVAGFE